MNQTDLYLKLQALLDNELDAAEARQMTELLARDPQAKAIHAELQETRALLAGNELAVKVPESREFYWSKIEREIQRLEQTEARKAAAAPAGLAWLRRWVMPVAGVAVVLCGLALVQFQGSGPDAPFTGVEVSTMEGMGSKSDHDHAAGITMVWVYDQSEPEFTEKNSIDNIEK